MSRPSRIRIIAWSTADIGAYKAQAGTGDTLTADDLESASNLSTPAIAGEHALLADNLESSSDTTTPAIAGEHALLADDLESEPSVTTPTATEDISSDILTADDLESASQESTPAIGQEHALFADDLESAANVTTPLSAGENTLLADNLQSDPLISNRPLVGQGHTLSANDLNSESSTSTPVIGQGNALLADDLESASSTTTPSLIEDSQNELLADDLESVGNVSSPAIEQVHTLLADDLESERSFSLPVAATDREELRPDADVTVGNWTTELGGTTNLYQSIDEATIDDGDYIKSEENPSNSATKVRLGNPTGTISADDTHFVRYRYQKSVVDGQQIDLTVRLFQGSIVQVIAEWRHADISNIILQKDQPLTPEQKTLITDYDDLFLEFEAARPEDRVVLFNNNNPVEHSNSDIAEFNY